MSQPSRDTTGESNTATTSPLTEARAAPVAVHRQALPPLASLAGLEDDESLASPTSQLTPVPLPGLVRHAQLAEAGPAFLGRPQTGPNPIGPGHFLLARPSPRRQTYIASTRVPRVLGSSAEQQARDPPVRRRAHSLNVASSALFSPAQAGSPLLPHDRSSSASASFRPTSARPRITVPEQPYSTSSDSPSTGHSARSNPFFGSTPVQTPLPVTPRPTTEALPPSIPPPQRRDPLSYFSPAPSIGTNLARPASTYMQESHMFTVDAGQGPISIPIDVRGASRDADEKRRRNADASARFRARKRERQETSSVEVEGLRQRLEEARQDADFYRSERDALSRILFHSPQGPRYFPRPPSPRRLRPPAVSVPPPAQPVTAGETSPSFAEFGDRGGTGKQSRRRLDVEQQPQGGQYSSEHSASRPPPDAFGGYFYRPFSQSPPSAPPPAASAPQYAPSEGPSQPYSSTGPPPPATMPPRYGQ